MAGEDLRWQLFDEERGAVNVLGSDEDDFNSSPFASTSPGCQFRIALVSATPLNAESLTKCREDVRFSYRR
jgi:hypothetical protein